MGRKRERGTQEKQKRVGEKERVALREGQLKSKRSRKGTAMFFARAVRKGVLQACYKQDWHACYLQEWHACYLQDWHAYCLQDWQPQLLMKPTLSEKGCIILKYPMWM